MQRWLGAIFDWFRGMDSPFNLLRRCTPALLLLLVDLYARNFAAFSCSGDALVLSHRLSRCSLTASHHRHRRWFCPGRILFYLFREPSLAGCQFVMNRASVRTTQGATVVCSWARSSGPGVSCFFGRRSRSHRGNRVLRSGFDRFPQDERKVAVEHAVCAGALFARQYFSLLFYRCQCRSLG